jgi:Uma2 family endonuclease
MAALPNSPLIPVEEYLNTAYDPDVEFVDGVLVERNVGDWLHSLVQSNVLFALRRKYPHLKVVAELRTSVTGTRFRLPDVCVLLTAPKTRYLLDAAFLVVEVLSESDVMSVVIEKLKEYANKGVPNIWLVDPRLQLVWMYQPPTLVEVEGEAITTADRSVELFRSEVFAE